MKNLFPLILVASEHSSLFVRANTPARQLGRGQVRGLGGTSQCPPGAQTPQRPQVRHPVQCLHTVQTGQPAQQPAGTKPSPGIPRDCRVSPSCVLRTIQGHRLSSQGPSCWSLRPRRHCPLCRVCSATVSGNNHHLKA